MKKLIVFVFALVFFASCTSTKIVTDSIGDIDFSDYQTVSIEYQTQNGEQISPINVQRVEKAIKEETKSRGFTKADDADLIIAWGVGVEIQKNYSTHSTYHHHGGYGYRGRYGGYSTGSGHSNTSEYTTKNGTFQVALVDAKTNQVLWIGTASDTIKGKTKKAENKIHLIVERVFEEFPIEKYS